MSWICLTLSRAQGRSFRSLLGFVHRPPKRTEQRRPKEDIQRLTLGKIFDLDQDRIALMDDQRVVFRIYPVRRFRLQRAFSSFQGRPGRIQHSLNQVNYHLNTGLISDGKPPLPCQLTLPAKVVAADHYRVATRVIGQDDF